MELGIDETAHLNVFAFPTQAQQYTDEIICLIKDNPNPVIFKISCLGQIPICDVDQEIVEFDRLLLGKSLTKTLTLTNNCALPIKWTLQTDEQNAEIFFAISKVKEILKPCKEELVDITFKADKQGKFSEKLTLLVSDNENENQVLQEQ